MLDDDIKQQAREIVAVQQSKTPEEKEIIGISQSFLDKMPADSRAWYDAALDKEVQRRESTLEENERKYQAAEVLLLTDEKGNLEENIVVGTYYWENGELNLKLNAFGYDRLPPDIQEAFGKREDVVEKYIKPTDEAISLQKAYVRYTHKDNEGYDTWEEYRDAKGLGPKEEKTTIVAAQNVDKISAPKETPSVAPDEPPELACNHTNTF